MFSDKFKGEIDTDGFLENNVYHVQVQLLVRYSTLAPGKIALILRGLKYGLKGIVILSPNHAEELGKLLSQAAVEGRK
jgi:hypothetical protein